MPAKSKRDQIVSQALTLFYREGFNATGVERIISEAGVSKKTLYNHFKSKDELILAALGQRDQQFRKKIMADTERLGDTPAQCLLSIFDAHHQWFQELGFCGCMFINACAEFSAPNHPCHTLSADHKRLLRDYIRTLAERAGVAKPAVLARQLNLLLEGAIVEAHVGGNLDAALIARDMAEVWVKKALQ